MSNQARIPYLLLALGALAAPGYSQLATADLGSGLTPEDLVSTLLGGEITVSNVEFCGAGAAAGRFTGGTGITASRAGSC